MFRYSMTRDTLRDARETRVQAAAWSMRREPRGAVTRERAERETRERAERKAKRKRQRRAKRERAEASQAESRRRSREEGRRALLLKYIDKLQLGVSNDLSTRDN